LNIFKYNWLIHLDPEELRAKINFIKESYTVAKLSLLHS